VDRDLLDALRGPPVIPVAPDVFLLRKFTDTAPLIEQIEELATRCPFRILATPGGKPMSVSMINCGSFGWHSDRAGYRYVSEDPLTGRPWPQMPRVFAELAARAADVAGFEGFMPDCGLVNRYAVGARMGSHRDADELDFSQPIVSVSIGLPAIFVWHGETRSGTSIPVVLADGDVMVWGRSARLGYHAVRAIKVPMQPGALPCRYNLTFRRAR
jgi:alkylated DNA repair protein (DNA oxidative demethylase)